ncbi:MAG TPA: PQQ-binding-like beta-propeller repeat protein [Lacipirellulaceae bacterium]|nr:PQQ-binding-like beta-propeller repeat protein [Lacipirellulaceae bacterium]
MSSPTEVGLPQPRAGVIARSPARWRWFPPLWIAALAALYGWIAYAAEDRGLVNSMAHICVAVAVTGLAAWVLVGSGLTARWRRVIAVGPMLLLGAYYLQFLPIKVINDGDVGIVGWRWRWADPDRGLNVPATQASVSLPWRETPQDYPAFLGGRHWAEVEGVVLQTDWRTTPPKLLWKQPIGAGWSSFAVVGDYAVTQEQRGDQELVTCYEAATGRVAWTHGDPVRWDPRGSGSLGGVGPRATPTIHAGRVYAHRATGLLNCLDARTGKLLWRHDTLAEHNGENVMWGKSGSPLVVDDWIVVSVGAEGASLAAYDAVSGEQAWAAGDRQSSYATPVLAELAGERQIVVVNEGYVTGHRAADGAVLWEHLWPSSSNSSAATSQPVPLDGDRLLLTKGYGLGGEVIEIRRDGDDFTTETLWKSSAVLKTKMGSALVRDGFAYGLNDVMFQCVDLATGRPRWTKRRSPSFGHGQSLLVGDVILYLSEEGELVLLEATPAKYRELASLPALEGVTWNNPALAGRLLLVRNAEQAACFELPLADADEL